MAQEQKFTIGRSPQCDIVLADESVSRNHAELVFYSDGRMLLADCNSSLGTFVLGSNGVARRISQEAIADRDNVLFGEMGMPVRELVNSVRHKLVIPLPITPSLKPKINYDAERADVSSQQPEIPSEILEKEKQVAKNRWIFTFVGIVVVGLLLSFAIGVSHLAPGEASASRYENIALAQNRQAEEQRQEALQRAAEAEAEAEAERHRIEDEQRQAEIKAQRIKRIIEDGAKNIVSKGSFIMTVAHPTADYVGAEFQGIEPANDGYMMTFDMQYRDTTVTSNTYWLRLEVLIDENGKLKDYHYGRDTGYVAPGALSQAAADILRSALQGT